LKKAGHRNKWPAFFVEWISLLCLSLCKSTETMNLVENFILSREGKQREVMNHLHYLLTETYNLGPKIKFGIPFYYRKHWVCYLNPLKGGLVELVFLRGNELSNEQGILNGKNRKMVKGIEIAAMHDVPENHLHEIINEAILLDSAVPYSLKPKNRNEEI